MCAKRQKALARRCSAAWAKANVGRIKAKNQQRYVEKKEHILQMGKTWRANNKPLTLTHQHNRRARELRIPGTHTAEEWIHLCNSFENRCVRCGATGKLTRDHIIPVVMPGASNSISNIQPLCKSCNSSKQAKAIDYRQTPFTGQGRTVLDKNNMATLKNTKHELFAAAIANGSSPGAAYVQAGYNNQTAASAAASGSRLLKNAAVQQRLAELKPAVDAQREVAFDQLVKQDAMQRAGRIAGYIERREQMLTLLRARAADATHAAVPGSGTGLLATTFEMVGKEKIHVAKFDAALLRELRELEKQIAIEAGHWVEKRDIERKITLADVPTDELRERSAAMKAKLPPELLEALELAQKQVIQ